MKRKPSHNHIGSGAAAGSNNRAVPNKTKHSSSGGVVVKHKKPERLRNSIVRIFDRAKELPDGECGMLVLLPRSRNGPLRFRSLNLTMQQAAAVLEALNSELPYPDQRIGEYVQKMYAGKTGSRHKRKRKQLSVGECCCKTPTDSTAQPRTGMTALVC